MKQKFIISIFIVGFLSSCCCQDKPSPAASYSSVQPKVAVDPAVVVRQAPEAKWEETMHDTIAVPGQLDPTKTYYRAPHKTVVEIRPGKHQPVTYTGDPK
jgi:hypothetical protein